MTTSGAQDTSSAKSGRQATKITKVTQPSKDAGANP
jgi:hypothetical protein